MRRPWSFRIQPLALLLMLIAIAGTSCRGLDDDSGGEQQRLDANRARWRDQHVDSYTYVLTRICFCADANRPASVVVRNGQRISVTDVASGQPVVAGLAPLYLTVDELFDFIANAIDRKAAKIDVQYDATLGYPTSIAIDYSVNIADEEMSFKTAALQTQR